MSTPKTPPSGDACLCCRNSGVLPVAKLSGQPVNMPGLVDSKTVLQCCNQCIGALFLGGTHPHPLDAQRIIGGVR